MKKIHNCSVILAFDCGRVKDNRRKMGSIRRFVDRTIWRNAKLYTQAFFEHIFIHLASVELIQLTVLKGFDLRQGEWEVIYCWHLIKNTIVKHTPCVSTNMTGAQSFLAPYAIILLSYKVCFKCFRYCPPPPPLHKRVYYEELSVNE